MATADATRFDRVDPVQQVALFLMLDVRRLLRIDHASADSDQSSGEKVQIGFPVVAVHGEGRVTAHAPALVYGERRSQARLIEGVDGGRRRREHGLGRAAHQRAVRGGMVVGVEPGPDAHVEIVQGGDRADVIEASFAQGPPEALHLAAGRGVIRLGVNQGGTHARARQRESRSAIGGSVVQVEGCRRTVQPDGAHQDREHVHLALLGFGLDDRDVARGVVEKRVDAHGVAADQRRAVTDVALPERHGSLGLPAQPHLAAAAGAKRRAIDALLLVESPQRRLADAALLKSALGHEGA